MQSDIKLSVVLLIVMAPQNVCLELEISVCTSRSCHDIKAKCSDTHFNDTLYNSTQQKTTQTNVLYFQSFALSILMLSVIFFNVMLYEKL
jgi:hypothetical protein